MFDYKTALKKFLKILINAFIGGLIISLMCLIYLIIPQDYKVLSIIIFPLGYFFIFLYAYDLMNFKLPYVVENKADYFLEVLIIFIGNFIGITAGSFLSLLVNQSIDLSINLNLITTNLLQNEQFFFILGMSIVSGLLQYLMYNTYKKADQVLARYLVVFIGGTILILANLYEFSSSLYFLSLRSFINGGYGADTTKLLFILLGNFAGGIIIPLLRKVKGLLA